MSYYEETPEISRIDTVPNKSSENASMAHNEESKDDALNENQIMQEMNDEHR